MAEQKWFKVEGSEATLRRCRRDLKEGQIVLSTKESFYVGFNGTEQRWFEKVTADHGITVKQCEEPAYTKMPCGAYSTTLIHQARCKSCQSLRPQTKVRTVVSVPGLQDFNLSGMLEVMEQRKEEAFQLAAQIETACNALRTWVETQEQFRQLQEQVRKDKEAVRFFIEESLTT